MLNFLCVATDEQASELNELVLLVIQGTKNQGLMLRGSFADSVLFNHVFTEAFTRIDEDLDGQINKKVELRALTELM